MSLGAGHKIARWKKFAALLMLYDMLAIVASYFLALYIRFDFVFGAIPKGYLEAYTQFILIFALVSVIIFCFLSMYRTMWAFAGLSLLVHVVTVSIIDSVIHAILITVFIRRMPASYYILGAVFQGVLLVSVRFINRFRIYIRALIKKNKLPGKRIMLIGAGDAGQSVLRDIKSRNDGNQVVCAIDDNTNKWHREFGSVPVVGGRDDILKAVQEYKVDTIFLTMPSAPAEAKREILNICSETDCEVKQLPGIYQLISGDALVSQMKEVSVEDLLGRSPIRINVEEISEYNRSKTILVTGGGGSIGSELCRQIANHSPKKLIIFDIYENNAYDIQMELKRTHPELDLEVLIGSVRDSRRIFGVFETYHPQIVYHAAAHKHVPLMEDSPCEAIKNNAIGTYKTAYAAMANGTERFVLISTDKAVNPTNVMGASKRLCEMIIQSFDRKIKAGKAHEIPQLFTHEHGKTTAKELKDVRTEFTAVRFGNVLGSNGSVIPLFRRQIEQGGPVTVTHPDIIRYFMTIPEAVSLVLLAGANAKGGEIFVLDMGSPVRIVSLARNLIKQSGLRPDIDIKIEYTGLRPGEKLYEEKLMAEEGVQKTENDLIHIGNPIPLDEDKLFRDLATIMEAAYTNNNSTIRELILKSVPTYHPENAG